MSANAIHTFVQLGRHGILERLGIYTKKPVPSIAPITEFKSYSNSDDYDKLSSENETDMPTKTFVFTLSAEEWQQIQPQEVVYKLTKIHDSSRSYLVLPKGTWTPVLAEHFWIHTELPCSLSFKRAKVYPIGQVYIKVVGRCSVCGSNFEGSVLHRPAGNSKVIMQCTYRGNFHEKHKIKKRRMVGSAKEKAATFLCKNGISSESYQELEANRIVKIAAQWIPLKTISSRAKVILRTIGQIIKVKMKNKNIGL